MQGAVRAGGEKPRIQTIPGPTSPRAELLEELGEEAVFWEWVSQRRKSGSVQPRAFWTGWGRREEAQAGRRQPFLVGYQLA